MAGIKNDRFNWALQLMDIKPVNNVLEIGCGVGLAVDLIASNLREGKITAIDKSKSMIYTATKRNAEHIKNKKAEFHNADLPNLSLASTFDTIFCFNVNVFWTKNSVTREMDVIRKHLSKKGLLFVFYGPMFAGGYRKIVDPVKRNLMQENFNVLQKIHEKKIRCCCFVAAPHRAV